MSRRGQQVIEPGELPKRLSLNEAIEKEIDAWWCRSRMTPVMQQSKLLRESFIRIYAAAAEEEREACAKVCLGAVGIRQRANDMDMDSYDEAKSNGHDEALVMACAAIRARGQGNEKTV